MADQKPYKLKNGLWQPFEAGDAVPVPNGGTGLTTIAANRVLYTTATDTVGTSANLTFDGANLAVSGYIYTPSYVGAAQGYYAYTADDANNAAFIAQRGSGVDSTHLQWVFSQRSNNRDFWLYSYNGTGYINWICCNESTGYLDLDPNGALTGVRIGGNTIWHAGNDGAASGLDADLLDGQQASAFAAASHTHDIDDLADVNAPSPADNDVLTWDSGAGEWVPAAPAGGAGSDKILRAMHFT